MSESTMLKLNVGLSISFNRYAIRHPEVLDNLPESAVLFFASTRHPRLTKKNYEMAVMGKKKYRTNYYVAKQNSHGWKIEKAVL